MHGKFEVWFSDIEMTPKWHDGMHLISAQLPPVCFMFSHGCGLELLRQGAQTLTIMNRVEEKWLDNGCFDHHRKSCTQFMHVLGCAC